MRVALLSDIHGNLFALEAEYAVIDRSNGELNITLRRTPYDIAPLLEAAKASGMPHAEWWCKDWG